jgi:hypothetical protein
MHLYGGSLYGEGKLAALHIHTVVSCIQVTPTPIPPYVASYGISNYAPTSFLKNFQKIAKKVLTFSDLYAIISELSE